MKVYVITYHTMLLGEYEETCCHRVFEKKEHAIECLNNMFKEITESEEQYKNQIKSGKFVVEKYDEDCYVTEENGSDCYSGNHTFELSYKA